MNYKPQELVAVNANMGSLIHFVLRRKWMTSVGADAGNVRALCGKKAPQQGWTGALDTVDSNYKDMEDFVAAVYAVRGSKPCELCMDRALGVKEEPVVKPVKPLTNPKLIKLLTNLYNDANGEVGVDIFDRDEKYDYDDLYRLVDKGFIDSVIHQYGHYTLTQQGKDFIERANQNN